ncbi:PREDICTED: uncharacterized protein LOC109590020 [Amphimedon queenslandica]|uniref:Uncharacterized protein n=1 Tax=Amphimedon queenslandica TaxID=400682 RepID=A0AAN0JWT4_AMPQE|nr:PREDICTED: uncharacterized protein LOC109590020 [Amphimedon queenslandica]|eukprot:XP_019861543.1 PREDICTED: uncharacterized protein LOC109590020 [Amphimedon queenslandica]
MDPFNVTSSVWFVYWGKNGLMETQRKRLRNSNYNKRRMRRRRETKRKESVVIVMMMIPAVLHQGLVEHVKSLLLKRLTSQPIQCLLLVLLLLHQTLIMLTKCCPLV